MYVPFVVILHPKTYSPSDYEKEIVFINSNFDGNYNQCVGTECAGQKDRRKMGQGIPVERDSQSPEGGVQESVWHHSCWRPIYAQEWK